MVSIYLVRHGEPDGTQIAAEGWRGPVRDLAALSALGVEQAKAVGQELRSVGAHRIVASPMARALHTASLIAAETQLPLTAVEFDLREWLPDSSLSWQSFSDVQALSNDLKACGGEWPAGETRLWEPLSTLRTRAANALRRQGAIDSDPFIAVCHGMVIEVLTGHTEVEHCGVRVLETAALTEQL